MATSAARRRPATPPLQCARRVLATVPPLMREIRREMRAAATHGLTVPQLRILIFARNNPGASVTDLAAHLGVTVPSASVAVDRLVRADLLAAPATPDNRRRLAIAVTTAGARIVDDAVDLTARAFAQRLSALNGTQLAEVQRALALLEQHLTAVPPEPGGSAPGSFGPITD
jgi:DNA-binding MarR family transcriptional regulator